MLSIFMMLIIAIAMAAALGFGILSLIKTAETSLGIQKNQVRLAAVAASIRSYVRMDGEDVLIPVDDPDPENGTVLARVPGFTPYSTTVWGKPLIYCPVSPAGAVVSGTDFVNGDEESYQVEYTAKGEITYVSAGVPNISEADLDYLKAKGVIALILSPGPNSDGKLKCSDIELINEGEIILIDGGTVREVLNISSESDGKTFVLSGGNTSGSRSFAASMYVDGFSEITSYVKGYGTRDIELFIPVYYERDDVTDEIVQIPYFVSKSELADLLAAMKGRTLRLTGYEIEVEGETLRSKLGIEVGQGSENDKEWEPLVQGNVFVLNVDLEGYETTSGGENGDGRSRSIDIGMAIGREGRLVSENSVMSHAKIIGGTAIFGPGTKIRPEYGTKNFEIPLRVETGRLLIDANDSQSSPFLSAVTATNAILVSGGSAEVKSSFSATLGEATERLFLATDGGRISRASPTVVASVTRAMETEAETIPVLPELVEVSETCDDDAESCSVVCPSISVSSYDLPRETFVAWGECSSSDGAAISGTVTAADRKSFTCAWQRPVAVTAPKVKAFCEIR